MKKIVALLLCALFLTVLALSFTSCNLIKDKLGLGDNGDEDGDNTADVGGDNNSNGDPAEPEIFKVSFELENGADNVELTYEIGSKIVAPETPTRVGYTFLGWYNGDVKWDFENDVITGPLQLKAKWTVIVYNVIYNLGDGTVVNTNPSTFDVETGDLTLDAPKRDNFIFDGWYLDADFTERVEKINVTVLADVTLYAKWLSVADFFTYEVNAMNKATLTTYNGDFEILNIPETIDGYEISELGENLFADCKTLVSVLIPDTVETICDLAFAGCESLESVTFGSGVKYIGNQAFYLCIKIVIIVIPDSVTEIGSGAFSGCSGATSITIGNGVTTIGSGAFANCSGATNLELGNSVVNIGENAFYLCIKIVIIVIPDSVTEIGSGAFSGCSGATSITVGNGVTTIGSGAFANCSGATNLELGNSVVNIGENAFYLCIKIVIIVIPDSVTEIGSGAFSGCSGATSITVGNGVTTIGSGAFANCSGATSVTLGSSVQNIGQNAFYLCIEIVYIIIPEGVTFVGENAFGGCENTKILVFWTEVPLEWAENWLGTELDKIADLFEKDSWEFIEGGTGEVNTFSDWYVYKEATCGEDGELRRDYLNVPGKYQSEVITATGDHDYQFNTTVAPDCDDSGYDVYECSVCHGTENRNYVDELGHSDAVLETVLPLCESSGYTVYKCALCEREEKRDFVDALGHSFEVTETVAPTCETEGYTNYECSACNKTKTDDYVDALAHNDKIKSIVAPTCTESGYTIYSCTRCKREYADDAVDPLGHDYASNVTSPTCTEDGYTTYTCQRSGCTDAYVSDKTGALGHDYQYSSTVAPTCEKVGYDQYDCTRCNSEENRNYVSALGHNEAYVSTIAPTCTSVGYDVYFCNRCETHYHKNETKSLGHSMVETSRSELSCTTAAYVEMTCTVCGATSLYDYRSPTGHDYVNSKCENCGDIISEGLNFTKVNDSYYMLTSVGYCEDTDIVIPATYEGLPVMTIDTKAFYNNTAITSVVIPEGVTAIGSSAFYGCSSLKKIVLPSTLQSIMYDAFYYCYSLEEIVVNTVEFTSVSNPFSSDVGSNSANGIKVVFGEKVKVINGSLFYGVTNVSEVVFAKNGALEKIEAYAFYNTSIKSAVIPETVKELGTYAFAYCKYLEKIYYNTDLLPVKTDYALDVFVYSGTQASGMTVYVGADVTAIPNSMFSSSNGSTVQIKNVVFSNSGKLTYIGRSCFAYSALTSINIPDSVTEIANDAFRSCSNLTAAVLPESLSVIPGALFYECYNLETVNLPKALVRIDSYAFYGCTKLSIDVVIPDGSKMISEYVFYNCSSLKSVTIPRTVTEIGNYAFANCASLESIALPEKLTTIGSYSFYCCTSLKSVTIPNSVKLIGYEAFYQCAGLLEVNIDPDASLETISSYAFAYCHNLVTFTIPKNIVKLEQNILSGSNSLTLIKIYITNWKSSSEYGDYSFSGINSYFTVFIANTVNAIPSYAFDYTYVSNVIFEENSICSSINKGAFTNCRYLTSITIPKSVVTIEKEAFRNNSSLISVSFEKGSKLEFIGYEAFYTTKITSVDLPKSLKSIDLRAFGYCTYLESVSFESGCLLESIGEEAFANCTVLNNIVIPNGVTSIGKNAFSRCTSLKNATLPDALKELESYVFNNCEALVCTEVDGAHYIGSASNPYLLLYKVVDTSITSFTINEKTKFIYEKAFADLTNLTKVVLSDNIVKIPEYCFSGCSSLVSVTIPNTVIAIEGYAFAGCASLSEITIPSGVVTIGMYAFKECASIKQITIPETVTSIRTGAFAYCSSLIEMYIPDNVINVGEDIFSGCSSLTKVNLPKIDGYLGIYFGTKSYTGCVSARHYSVWGYINYSTQYYYPATLTSVTVRSGNIGYSAFSYCSNLTEIILGDGVTYVGNYAFAYCGSIKELVIPENVTYMGLACLGGCKSLETLTIPIAKATNRLSSGALSWYPLGYLFGTIGESGTYTSISQQFFSTSNSSSLSSVTGYIPNSLKHITVTGGDVDYGSFQNMSGLTSITLGDGVKKIMDYAFQGCTGLKTISIGNEIEFLSPLAFYGLTLTDLQTNEYDNAYYLGNATNPYVVLLKAKDTSITSCEIHSGTVFIYNDAFLNCTALETVTIPANVKGIGTNAFKGCSALKEIYFNAVAMNDCSYPYTNGTRTGYTYPFESAGVSGDGIKLVIGKDVTRIPAYLLYHTSTVAKVVSVEFENGSVCEYIGDYALYKVACESIKIPSTVTYIGNYAFYYATKLTSLEFESGSAELNIGNYAFYNNNKLTELTVPARVVSAGEYAFSGARNLKTLTFENRSLPLTLGMYAFYDNALTGIYVLTAEDWLLITFANAYSNPLYTGSAVLYVNNEPISAVDVPYGITAISAYAFYNCSTLTSIIFSNTVTSVGNNAFYNCVSLTDVEMTESVATVDANVFAQCASLKNVTIPTDSFTQFVRLFGTTGFTGAQEVKDPSNTKFYVPKTLKSIKLIGGNVISVNKFYKFSMLEEITIPAGITAIEDNAFVGCENISVVYYEGDINGWMAISFANTNSNPAYYGAELYFGGELVEELEIPSGISTINPYAFAGCVSLKSLIINENVTSISNYAFYGCTGLEYIYFNAASISSVDYSNYIFSNAGSKGNGVKVVIGNKITAVPAYLFRSSGKITSVEFEEGSVCQTIGTYAFQYLKELAEVGLPESLRVIEEYAFQNCSLISKITLPDGLEYIGNYAFSNCTSITEITLPDSVTEIGYGAFNGCTNLASVRISSNIKVIGDSAFNNCSIAYTEYENACYLGNENNPYLVLIKANSKSITSCIIHEDTKVIYPRAFENCTALTSITIPKNVVYLGSNAFRSCTALADLVIEYGLTSIGSGAFAYCTKLTNVTIPASVLTIEDNAFYNCTGLVSVTIPDSVTRIGDYAFYYCSSLVSVHIPSSVTVIGGRAFYQCAKLETVVIDNGIVSIGEGVFYYCSSLKSISIGGTLETIGTDVFYSCTNLKYTDYGNARYVGNDDNPYLILVKATDTSITYCNIHPDTKIIYHSAFYYCTKLTSVTIPEGVVMIGMSAFYNCSKLESVVIANSVKEIGSEAFERCSSLKSISLSIDSLKLKFSEITDMSVKVNITGGTKIPAELFSYSYVSAVVLCDSITEIEYRAFYNCTNLYSINLEGVAVIGEEAFYYCSKLSEIALSDELTELKDNTFYYCSALSEVTLPKSIVKLGNNVFYSCSAISRLYYGGDVLSWLAIEGVNNSSYPLAQNGTNVYFGDDLVSEIVIPDGVQSIRPYAFYGWKSLRTVVISEGVTTIDAGAFYASGVANVSLPNSLRSIETNAFYSCKQLYSIVLPEGLTSLGQYAFSNCSNLSSVVIPTSMNSMESTAFYNTRVYRIYYMGTADEWANMQIDPGDYVVAQSSKFFYSETKPEGSDNSGSFWHFDADGNPVEW